MAESDLGDINLDGKDYRIVLASYRINDIVDFAPRATTPGGSILMSQLGLYQPLYQTDWRHGFGHYWYDDASGYMRTDGNIDTRQGGLAMLFTNWQQVTQSGANNLAGTQGGFLTWNGNLFAWGDNGVWVYTGSVYNSGFTQIETGTVQMAMATGPFLYWCRSGARIQKYNGAINNNTGNTLTISHASPAVCSCTAHGLTADDPVRFFTTGSLPAPLTPNTVYYVISAGLTANAFEVSATRGGAAINTTTGGSGTQTFVAATKAGSSGSATPADFQWGIMSGGYFFLGDANSSRIHYDNDDNGLTGLEGGATDAALIYLGAGGYPTLGGANYFGHLYVFRVDGIYLLDTTALVASKVLDFADQASSTNFRSWAVHEGFLVFPIRDRLFQWNGIRLADITPPQVTDIYPYVMYGRYDNFVVLGQFLYCTARDSALPYNEDLLCFDGVGWTKLARLVSSGTTAYVSAMGYDVVNNRLWVQIADPSGTPQCYAFQFNSLSEFPYPNFPTSGTHSLISSRLDLGFRRVTKSTPRLDIRAINCSSGVYLKVYYALDGGAWTAWGNNDGVTNVLKSSGNITLKDPLGDGTGHSSIEYKYLMLRFDFVTNDATNTPVMEEFTVTFIMRPDVAFGYAMQILAGQNQNFGGFIEPKSGAQIEADLKTSRNSKPTVTFIDLLGASHQVYISSLQGTTVERHLRQRAEDTGQPDIEEAISINLVELL